MQNNDNTRKLYDALVADNYELGDYEKFTSDISNPEYMRKLYDTMVADDYELGEYNTFSSRYSVTPQGNAAQATQATARTAQPVVDAYGMPMQPEVSTIEDAPKVEEKPQENLKSDLFKPQSTETPSLLNVDTQAKDYFAEAGAKAMEGIRQERQAREYQEIMKPLSGIEGSEQKKVLEERKKQIEAQLNQPDAVRNAAARTNMAKALENVDKELQVLNEQQKQWQEQYGSWTPSSARRFREQTMEQTWHDPYAVVPEEYKALATQKWGKEGSEDAYFSAWMNLSPEEREAFVKREHIKSFFNEETANKMQGIRERATTYAQNALSEPVVSVDPRHSASAMAARTVSNIGVQTTKALDKAEEIKQAYKNHELDENFFAGAYKGMKDGLTDIDNWTGLYMVGEMTNLYDIADKMEKGEALSQTEEDFLDAQAYKLAVEAALADDLGWGYSSGNVTGASVPFMLQMLASPIGGASGKAIDKGFAAVGRRAIDKFGKGILKKLLTKAPVKKIAKGLVGTVGKGIGQTILFGSDRVAAGTMERHLGNEMVAERANEEFNAGVQAKAGEDWGTAFLKEGVSRGMENISEFAGGAFIDDFTKMVGKKISKEFMDAMGGSVGRRMANAAARQNANKVFRAIANNKWGQHAVNLSKSVQNGMEWDGLLNEFLEEVLNNASNVMIGDMSMEDFTSLEKNAETLLGLAWTSGFFMANNAASRVGGYVRGNIALKRTDRAARQVFTGDMQEKWDAYTQALSQADGYEEVEQLYKGLMTDISKNQDKEAAKAQMSEAASYMTNYVKMMGMNAATEEADEEEQKTPAQKDVETAQGEGIAAQGTEEELDVVEEMDESYNQLAGHLGETNVEDWLLQYGETADKQLEAIRGSELDDQTKAMAAAYLTSAQRYEGLLLANQEEVDAIVEEAAKEFDANVNQELGSVIQVLTTQGKTAYVIQGNPNERENIRLRYEDGTTEPVSHTAIEKVLSQADAQTMRSDMIEGVRKSAVAEVVQRMQGAVPNATQMQMPVGHNVVVDGQAGVVAGVNADGTMQIQMQGGNVVNAAPQQVMDAQAYNTIMERKARARESARVSAPVREEVATPVAEEATAAEAVAEEAIAAEEELTEAQKLLQEYMDESVSLEDRQAIVENNVAQAKQAAVEAQAEVDAMTESKPKATDYTSIAEFKQAQEEWKAQMQEKQQVLDLARQQEATWSEVQKGMVQPVETAAEQASAEAVPTAAQVTEVQRAEAKTHNSKHDIKALAKEIGVSAKRIQRVIDFANQVGVKLNFANVTRTQGNAGAFTNADNIAKDRTITLSKYQLAKGMAIEWVMGHELTHQIKADGNAANWEAYKQAIINALGQEAFDKRVKEQSKVYREAGAYQDMSANEFVETMQEEVCADAAGDMLLNPDNMNKVMGVPQSLASRIWSALKDMVTFSTPTKIKQAVDAWQQLAGGKELTGEAADREKHSIVSDKAGEELEETASATRYSIVVDPQLIAELEASPKRMGYRNVVQREDGLFEAPMGNSLRGNGITVENTPFAMGQWEQSEEHPELVYGDNKITLVKPDGKTVADVNYNPYIHNRLNTLNAQFKQAWERPDLVYIETEVPETDLEGGYMAEHAHLSTGVHQWSNGALMLSRYDKPVRIVPWEEVAIPWIEKYKKSGVHFDIVPPALRPILAAAGVEIKAPHKGMGENCTKAYEEWKAEQEVKYSVIKPIGQGYFGNIYDQFKGKPKEAIEFLMRIKEGEAIGALTHPEIGEIDLVWGKEGTGKSDGFGLAKLVKFHPEVLENLQGILDEMHVVTRSSNRVNLESDTHKASVRLTWDNQRKNWLLTAFEKKNSVSDNTTDTDGTSLRGRQNDTATLQDTVFNSKDTQSVSTEQTDKEEISGKSAESNVEVTNEGVMHSISPIEGYTYSEVIDMVQNDVENILSEEGIDNVEAVEFWAHGSRMRGNAKEDSDLDVVMFYKGNEKEDSLFNLINEHELAIDGIKVDVNPIRISNEQDIARYKEKSARYDQEMRFSLAGLHNISEEKLKKAIKQGGFANPSVAVIDLDTRDHNTYGDITLVLPSYMIDKKQGRNAGTYMGDAWTPTYPRVSMRLDNKGWRKIDEFIASISDDAHMRSNMHYAVEDFMQGGSTPYMQYAFLRTKGIEIPFVYKNNDRYISNEEFKELIGMDALTAFNDSIDAYNRFKELPKEVQDELYIWIINRGDKAKIKAMKESIQKDQRYANLLDYEVPFSKFNMFANDTFRREQDNGKIDYTKTFSEANNYVATNGLGAEYNAWISNLLEEAGAEEYIFAGFTPSGNAKYLPHTLENVSKVMKKDGKSNAYNNTGYGPTRAGIIKALSTLGQIRKNSETLRTDINTVDETKEELTDRLYELRSKLADMRKLSDNPFINGDYAESRLQEALSRKNPVRYLNEEYGYNIEEDGDFAKKLESFIDDVRKAPVRYFETKFERPVMLDEFHAAVIPNDTDTEVVKALEKAGLNVETYERGNDAERKEALLRASDEHVRFSLSAEEQDIVDAAKADGTYMKTPNGKPTNLNEKQWAQVRTKAFKEWFGDWENDPENASKVVDENGEPMVVYHYTPNEFTEFDTEKIGSSTDVGALGRGFYFSPSDKFTLYGDKKMALFVNAKNPMLLNDSNAFEAKEPFFKADYKWDNESAQAFADDVQAKGYDAVYYENRGMDEIVAFRPTQIKSATDNVGTFDAENADIRYSMPGHSVASRIYGHPFTGAWQKFLQRAPKGVLKPGYGIIDESRLPEFADWYRMLVPEAEEYKEFVSLFLEDATATEKKHIQSVMDRVDKIVDDYRRLAEGDNSVLSLENNARFSITPDILAANERFNEELDEFKAKTHKGLLHLGKPGAILRTIGVDADEMTISPTILHQHLKEHGLTVDDIKGLALSVQSPILAYRHGLKYPNLVIVTEMDVKGGKLSVSLELDGDGHIVAISNIKSVHSKDAIKEVERLMDMGAESLRDNLKWVEKEEVSDWLLRLPYEDERTKDNPKLSSVANVLLSFQNPPIIGDESSQNVENAKSGEQKYSLPGRPATPKRNEGESIMEYAQRVANATEAQKAWDVANKTAMDIDRQIKNSEEYRDILAQKEPQTIEEAASVALAGGKLLWNDHVDGTKVSKGAKSMMGWGEGERQRFFAMFASKENGGVSVEQMGEAVMDICSQYNIPVDETDAMAGTNAVLEVLQSAQRPSDITGYIEHNRIEQVRRMIEEEQELLAGERNKAYMDMYGMTYDDFVEIASTIDAEDEQERSDDKNVIAWLYGQSQRQQERITNAQTELEQLKMNGVPKTQYDAAYRALEQMKAKAKQIQAKLDEVTRELSAAKGQATRQKKANMRYKEKKGQWKQVYKELRQAINGKNIRSIDKSTLNEIMRAVGSADLSGMARLFGEAGMIEDIILGVNMRAAQDRIDKLLATKTTALNDKGIATGKSVDASVQAILANVRKTLEGILHHDIENQIHDLRSQNWHIRHNAVGTLSQEQQRQVDANKAKIEELKAELGRELATSTATTEQAVNEQIENLTEQIDKGLRTEEESAELMTTLALKRQMVAIHTSYQDTATVEALLRRKQSELRTNWVALHDGNTPQDKREEYRQKRKALQEQIAGLEAQVREGRQATIDAMQSFADSLEETITTGRANLKGKVQEQLQRRKDFVAKAIHDVNASGKQMQSVNEADKQENDKLPWYKRMFSPALRTFDYMLQKVATRTYGKDSWLYRQFMLGENGVMAAHDEYLRGMQTAARTLEDKAKEIFGKSYQDVMADSNRKKDIGIEILRDAEDYEPSYIPLKLTKGQATYIYMLWRMRDGYSKLATQGFTEEIMQRIEEYIGPDYIQWADWMQMEYLPMMREKYNARYREIYDTNMAAIDNYVPIRIHGQAIRKEVDLTDATASMPGMQKKNGALIQRTVNVNPIDISNNIFELIGQHIDEMEEFYAYAPVRRDLQYILSSPAFRNLLNTQEPGTFQSLLEAARIATKTNQQPESAALKAFNDVMNKTQKGLVSGNIAYRNMTAIKQVLSAPAFIGYSQSPEYLGILAGNMLGGYLRNIPVTMFPLIPVIGHWAQKMTVEETAKGMPYIDLFLGETFRWCMREFPDFRERVTRGSAGDIRLEEKGFSKLLDKYTAIGMSANVFIDAVTVSVGLKSIYDYEMKKAEKRIQKMAAEMQMDEQWEEEEMRKASNAAKIQATLFANQTQQSSNPALLSPMQVSKNFMERSLTLYKNSSLGLMRAGIGGMRNLLRYMKGKKARRRMTEEYTRMFMQEGFAENEAKKRAISYLNSEARKGAFVALLEGYVMNVIWNLGSKGLLGFMAGGGDDDDKERTIGEWVWDGIKHVVKNTFGSAMPFVNDALEGRLPAIGLTTSEAEKAWKDIKKQLDENGISLAFALTGMRYAAKFGGVDMQVWANTMDGYYRLFSETGNSDDNTLALMLILNSPHSNRMAVARELYKGKSEEEFQRAIELAGRYNQPVWTFGREMTDKVESDMAKWYLSDNATDEEKQRMRYIEEMEERIDNLETVEDALEMFDEVSDTELRKKISSKIDQISKPEDTFAEKVDKKRKNALAEDDADMEGYTYMKISDSQDLLEEKRMRAEIDMLRPIVEQQKELFEKYGSKSAVYTRFMAEHGAEIRRYNTLKAYSRAIQTRKRKMDEEGADVQALYEKIEELYNDARNM